MPTNGKLSAKVSEKGAVSIYGLRRFPITFYKDEWEVLFEHAPKIKAFMKEHAKELKAKEAGEGPEGTTTL
jgi:hypothetical protein